MQLFATANNSANRMIFCVVYGLRKNRRHWDFSYSWANLHMSQAGNLVCRTLEMSLCWTQRALPYPTPSLFAKHAVDFYVCLFFSPYKFMIWFNKNITHLLPEGFKSFPWTHSTRSVWCNPSILRQLPALCSLDSLSVATSTLNLAWPKKAQTRQWKKYLPMTFPVRL